MKRFNLTWTISVFVILLLAFFLWSVNRNVYNTDLKQDYLQFPVEQKVSERYWRTIQMQLVAFSPDLLRPLDVIKDVNNFFYVGDWGDMKVKKFDTNGQLMEVFGEGQGRGPGEAGNIMDFQVDSESRVWITDNVNSRFTIFSDWESWNIYDTSHIPTRVLPISLDRYLIKPRFSSTPSIYNLNGELEVQFEPLVQSPELWSYVLSSFYSIDSSDRIIRTNVYTNEIVRYNLNGQIEYFRQGILPVGVEEIPILSPTQYTANQDVRFNEVHPEWSGQQLSGAQIVDGQIHLLVIEASDRREDRRREFVDVYEMETGDYIYSYRLPQALVDISITESHLAGIVEEDSVGLAIWEVNGGW